MTGVPVTMATMQTPRLPRSERHSLKLNRAIYGTGFAPKGTGKQILPGIGTFVIDSPKDRNSRIRQQCLKYQESHRGVLRSRIEALPDIPKRCVMRSLPIVQLRTTQDASTSPVQFDCVTPARGPSSPQVPSPANVHLNQFEGKHKVGDRTLQLKRQDSSSKLMTQEELVSRSPIGRVLCTSAFGKQNGPIAGFGVRNRKMGSSPKLRKEFTNLSVNVELSAHGPAPYKATDRELMSQAEYRRQFNFYLGQDVRDDKPARSDNSGDSSSADDDRSDIDTCRSLIVNIPANNIGHTSKYNIWASNLRLGEVLSNNATPDLKRKLAGSAGKTSSKSKSSSPQKHPANNAGNGEDYESDSYEEWMHVVNTPVVDRDIYDRYANVRLASTTTRLQNKSRSGKW